jgi:hypothetical protein
MAKPDCASVPAGMPFQIRNLRRTDAPPAAGELHVVPMDDGDRCLARLVLDRGRNALPSGPGPVNTIVIKADPTLDDMLAATIAATQLAGRPAPDGMRPFVEYAAVLRQGLSPGTAVPLERSLAGLYKAIRWRHGDLTDPVHCRRFCEDWQRLAATIFAYAADSLDPFAEFPLPSWLFADDQRFLAGDHDLYLRDKAAGESWNITISDEGPAAGNRPALFLRRPQSRLWKEWARCDPEAPRIKSVFRTIGNDVPVGYDFLAVDEEGTGNWVFSTNPVQRLSIRSLRDLLQKEEEKRSPERAADDPWVALFDNTLVAAPNAGTSIPEADLLRLVRAWASARPTRRRRLTRGVPVALACAGVVALLGARWAGASPASEPIAVTVVQDGKPPVTEWLVPAEEGARSREVDLNLKPGAEEKFAVQAAVRGSEPVLLNVSITWPAGVAPPEQPIGLKVNEQPLDAAVLRPGGTGQLVTEPQAAYLRAGKNNVSIRLVNDRAEEVRVQIRVTWDKDPNYKPDLYLLAVGTSAYHPHGSLPLAEPDAQALLDALATQAGPGRPFRKLVSVPENQKPLLHPTADQLLEAIAALKRKARDGGIAWVFISGHGEVSGDRFSLVLAGRNGADEKVPWGTVYDAINDVRCPVVVLLDTCASGTIQSDTDTLSRLFLSGKQSQAGRVIFSATFNSERAFESDEWKHSALCLAALESLTGEHLFNRSDYPPIDRDVRVLAGRRVVTLEDFRRYVHDRVGKLNALRGDEMSGGPGVIVSPGLNPATIPVAARH